jgi:AraC-like DNA-binding protein
VNNVFETIYLLAALQGVLLSAFLFTKGENRAANRILAVATLALSIELASVVYYANGWYKRFPHLMGFSYPFPLLYGPLFFLYAELVCKKIERVRLIDLLHFTPIPVFFSLTAPVFFYSPDEKITFVDNMIRGIHDPMYSVFEVVVPIQGIVYTILTIKTVADYNGSLKENFSNLDLINLNWLKYLTLGMIIIWSIVAFLSVARIVMPHLSGINALLNVPLAILIYSIGYMGLKQPEIFLASLSLSSAVPESGKYRRSGLNQHSAEDIKRRLLELMILEKPYLSHGLTLQSLAGRLNTSSHNLSEVINTRLGQTYYDFINQYRVEEFKRRVGDPANAYYNLLSIALDSGFPSKGTFNSTFKKFTHMTPSEYRASIARPTGGEASR